MRVAYVITMASGLLPDNSGMKFFFYAKEEPKSSTDLLGNTTEAAPVFYLAQVIVTLATGEVSAVIKCSNTTAGVSAQIDFPDTLISGLAPYEPRKI